MSDFQIGAGGSLHEVTLACSSHTHDGYYDMFEFGLHI
jgi:hypothetical protein